MMIPIRHKTLGIVSRVEFKNGKGIIIANDRHFRETGNVRNAVDQSAYLSKNHAISEVGFVRYWSGFWGWLEGLFVAMPPIGLIIDIPNIEWPKKETGLK
jgi:hypothetical protein